MNTNERVSRGQKSVFNFSVAGIICNCELPHIGAGNQSQVLFQKSMCS